MLRHELVDELRKWVSDWPVVAHLLSEDTPELSVACLSR